MDTALTGRGVADPRGIAPGLFDEDQARLAERRRDEYQRSGIVQTPFGERVHPMSVGAGLGLIADRIRAEQERDKARYDFLTAMPAKERLEFSRGLTPEEREAGGWKFAMPTRGSTWERLDPGTREGIAERRSARETKKAGQMAALRAPGGALRKKAEQRESARQMQLTMRRAIEAGMPPQLAMAQALEGAHKDSPDGGVQFMQDVLRYGVKVAMDREGHRHAAEQAKAGREAAKGLKQMDIDAAKAEGVAGREATAKLAGADIASREKVAGEGLAESRAARGDKALEDKLKRIDDELAEENRRIDANLQTALDRIERQPLQNAQIQQARQQTETARLQAEREMRDAGERVPPEVEKVLNRTLESEVAAAEKQLLDGLLSPEQYEAKTLEIQQRYLRAVAANRRQRGTAPPVSAAMPQPAPQGTRPETAIPWTPGMRPSIDPAERQQQMSSMFEALQSQTPDDLTPEEIQQLQTRLTPLGISQNQFAEYLSTQGHRPFQAFMDRVGSPASAIPFWFPFKERVWEELDPFGSFKSAKRRTTGRIRARAYAKALESAK